MSSEFMTAPQQKTGTVYRFIRVPEINQNTNIVLIKNPSTTESSTIAKVQKQVQHVVPAKLISTVNESSGGKKVKTRVSYGRAIK
jgi:hypothetical protein